MNRTGTISLGSFSMGIFMLSNWAFYVKERIVLIDIGQLLSAVSCVIFLIAGTGFYFVSKAEVFEERIKEMNLPDKIALFKENIKAIREKYALKKIRKPSENDELSSKDIEASLMKAGEELKVLQKKIDDAEKRYIQNSIKDPKSQEARSAFEEYEDKFYQREELLNRFSDVERQKLKKFVVKED